MGFTCFDHLEQREKEENLQEAEGQEGPGTDLLICQPVIWWHFLDIWGAVEIQTTDYEQFFSPGNKLLEIKVTRDADEKGMHDQFLCFRTLALQQ